MILRDDAIVIVAEFCLNLIDSRDEPRSACVGCDLSQLQQVEKSFGFFAPFMKLRWTVASQRPFARFPGGVESLGDALSGFRPMGTVFEVKLQCLDSLENDGGSM